ncbi:MAG: cysteine desulfurase family protein [Terrimicrobiaceae bacterium]|nr:cysteine desulfurase family protein [Terrimicrobiaceae bacterium]
MGYLDYNATTPLAPEALEAMLPFLRDEFGNPSSIHAPGRRSRAAIDDARDRLAALIGARPHEIIFTGGGTESVNLALIGLALAGEGRHLITAATEHHAVLHAMEFLRRYHGFDLTVLPVDALGRVDPATLSAAIRSDTALVSIMSANNETGTLQPIAELAAVCEERKVLFHSDMVQSFGKETVRPRDLGIAALSLAAHKFYGPKGVGALFLRAGVPITSLHHGGAHENQRRPGTENVAAIAGLAAAAEAADAGLEAEQDRQRDLRDWLWEGIREEFSPAIRNGDPDHTLANTLNVSFPGADGETLLIGLDMEGVSASSGSACMVGSVQPSHVLLAMGVPREIAQGTVRFSLGKPTTGAEIEGALAALSNVLERQNPTLNA